MILKGRGELILRALFCCIIILLRRIKMWKNKEWYVDFTCEKCYSKKQNLYTPTARRTTGQVGEAREKETAYGALLSA